MISKPQHIHPIALVFFLYDSLKQLVFPALIIFFGIVNAENEKWLIIFSVLLISFIIIKTFLGYFMFTYQLSNDEIFIKSGIFVKKLNHIPYERIQNITSNQWFFLKPFKLEELKIETAGQSDKPEVSLKAVPDSLRPKIANLRNHQEHSKSKQASENSYHISFRDLIKFSLTSTAIINALIVAFALFGKIHDFIDERELKTIADKVINLQIVLMILLPIAIFFVFYLLLSFILFSKYYDFKLTEAKGHLETMRGLFKTRKTNINLNRVQAILIKQNFLKRLFSIATVQLVIVSNSTEDDTEENVIIMPVINYEKVTDFLNQFFPNIPVEETSHFNPLTATYFYKFRNATIGMAITIGLIVLLLHRFVLLTTILSILGLLIWYLPAYLSAKRSNIQFLNDKYLQLQNNHLLTKQIALIPKASLQFTKKSQSLWLKRKNIANIALNIRSGVSQKTFAVTYQAENDIDSIMRWYKKTTNNQN
ncbi:PH domain-containing protein [Companilactobacillus halodurans]|uniref:YdbS-like PH domain-containing protein n=1 Tax=Companilactobacillus halodurans TaxID=2584183 RepID=A0A5P1A1D2_9LACO|nr:PH domain-containing protein [Companilactobacillus halodurans]MQS98618.1 hypothetical protein [Companilactobacillus halodurans]